MTVDARSLRKRASSKGPPYVHSFRPSEIVLPSSDLARFFLPARACRPVLSEKELKEPTEVDLAFSVKNEDPSVQDQGQGSGPSIDLETKNEGELEIQEVRVIGRRKEGEDVDFSRDESLELPMKEVQNGPKLRFDLPQGTYEDIELHLKLANEGNGAVRYEGRRIKKPVNGPSEATPFRLIIEEEKTIECQVDPSSGTYPIELRKGDPRRIDVELRPKKMVRRSSSGIVEKGGCRSERRATDDPGRKRGERLHSLEGSGADR